MAYTVEDAARDARAWHGPSYSVKVTDMREHLDAAGYVVEAVVTGPVETSFARFMVTRRWLYEVRWEGGTPSPFYEAIMAWMATRPGVAERHPEAGAGVPTAERAASLVASLDASRVWMKAQGSGWGTPETIPAGTLKAGDQINFEVVTTPWLKPDEWYLFHPADLEDVVRDALAEQCRQRIGAGAEKPSTKPVETEGDRLARFFATSAHEGHEQVRAEPERDELGAMIDSGPVAAARGEIAGDPRASAVFHDWGETCLAVEMRRQASRDLAASLARIPDDFDLLPDAE